MNSSMSPFRYGRPLKEMACLALLAACVGCSLPGRMLRGYAEGDPEGMELLEEGSVYAHAPSHVQGQVRFVFDDFGSLTTDGLETYGIPWKLAAAAVVWERHRRRGAPLSRRTLDRALEEHGFIRPRRIANWKGPQPRLDRPLGIVAGTARRGFPSVEIEIANLGCATCHAGPLYGADGRPTGDAWLGIPNASIELSGYGNEVFAALRVGLERPDSLLEVVTALFPEASPGELSTLKAHLIPRAREQLAERAERYGGLLPFENGGPGLSNGVGSLRFLTGILPADARHTEVAWASAPGLSGSTLRRSLLVDGVYAPPGSTRLGPLAADAVDDRHLEALAGVVSLFVVGTQGVRPERARDAIPRVHDVLRFVHELEPPPFPGAVDAGLAEEGAVVYQDQCASCHGRYSPGIRDVRLLEHPNRLVPQDRMRTDPVRWRTADPESLALLDRMGFGDHIEPLNGGGYVAPDLSGIWATAPYLHNGSVPTLWHLLHPEARPNRFYVGGHALDYERMGIAGELDDQGIYRFPEGYEPWSRPVLYDTSEPGRSNVGHDFANLDAAQKRAVLEYMKVL